MCVDKFRCGLSPYRHKNGYAPKRIKLMVLSVCVGSSCHLKGSYDVIETFKKLIDKHGVADKIELRACFCLGRCSDGVAVKADTDYILNVNGGNAEEKFESEILPLVK